MIEDTVKDEDKAIVRILYIFISVSLVGSIAILINGLNAGYAGIIQAGAASTVLCVTALGLLRAGKLSAAKIILPTFTYLIATYLIFTSDEVSVRDEAVLLYSLVVALAGLLLRDKGVIVFGALSLLTVEASVFAEIQGWIVNHIDETTTIPATMVIAGVVFGLTATITYILVDILTKSLIHSQTNRQGLLAANAQLIAMRESLEYLVEVRTRAAESARADAVTARHQAELQAWLARGQAQFADRIRGDLDISTLANRIAAQISQYVGAQCGALFVSSDAHLKLMGSYAYAVRDGQKSEFRLGEGSIGGAAVSKEIVRLKGHPADAPVISSGLGETMPSETLIVPIESNGQIFGVLQLATLGQFSAEHEFFLKRVSESAAIALQTAHTRAQLDQLFKNL
jgi:hypothetical protein